MYANGEDTGATVSESGSFSVQLPAGKHDFVFETEGYIAYADGVEVSATTEAINATLKKNTYAIGDYGALKSNTNPTFNENGTYTVSGKDQMIIFPHTATTDAFEYYVKVSDINRNSQHEAGVGICLTDGKNKLTVSCWAWGQIQVSMGAGSEENYNQFFYKHNDLNTWDGVTFKFVVDKVNAQILLYINNNLRFTFTKNVITPNVVALDKSYPDSLTAVYAEKIAGFFADGAKIAAGINGGFKNPSTATYTCSIAKFYAVSGTISAADGVDLTATTLTVDGISTPISVQGNGSYSVLIAEGKHTLVFANGKYGATKEITVVNGENIADVQLKDGTWLAGKYGNVASNNTPELNENGTYTVSGKDQMIIFPNTATSNSFTYEVTVNDINRSDRDSKIGICITDGNYRLAIGLSEDWQVLVSLSQDSGEATHNYYGLGGMQGVNGVKLKFVVTKQDIKFYVNNTLRFTFTSEEITSTISALTNDWVKDTLTDAYKNGIAGFFAENAKIAVGIMSGWKDSVTATYTCSITNN